MNETLTFLDYTFPIHIWEGRYFPDGQYSFPFSYVLSETLPSSFYSSWYLHGLTAYGKIDYSIRAGLRDPSKGSRTVYKDTGIVLSAKPTLSRINISGNTCNRNVSGYCVSHGATMIQTQVSEDRFCLGQVAEFLVSIDTTNSKTDLKRLRCKLVKNTWIKAKGRSHSHRVAVKHVDLPGIPVGVRRVGLNAFHVKLPLDNLDYLSGSVNGVNVVNSYQLVAEGMVNGCLCCDKHPNSAVSVTVYPKEVVEPLVTAMGSDWQPQVFDSYNCVEDPQYRTTQEFKNSILADQKIEMPKE